ncbi:MAG: hypothetical protein ACR2GR_00580 [Rhodothermales bacterium]
MRAKRIPLKCQTSTKAQAPANEALWRNGGLRNGTYVYRRHLTKKSLATMFGMPHRDIELLIASGI